MQIFSLVMNRDGGDIDTYSVREYAHAKIEAARVASQMVQQIVAEGQCCEEALSLSVVGDCFEIYQHDQGMVGFVKIHHTTLI